MIEAAVAAGIAPTEDHNGAQQEGAGWFQVTQRDGRRASTAVAYLRPVLARGNIDVLITSLEFDQPATVFPSTDFIDAAETLARQNGDQPPSPDLRRLLAALHSLRQIDRVVINAAIDLGADNGVLLPGPISDVECRVRKSRTASAKTSLRSPATM